MNETKIHWLKVRDHEGEGRTPMVCKAFNLHSQGLTEGYVLPDDAEEEDGYTCEEMAIDAIEFVVEQWNPKAVITTEKINDNEFYVVVKGVE